MHGIPEEIANDALFDQSTKSSQTRTFWEMMINYYSHTEYIRTPKQIRRDETIFFGRVRCKAWMIIPVAVLSQFCLGSLYAWSIFNKPIDNYIYGYEANRAQLTFYVALAMLGAAGAAFGPWIESHAPNMCAVLAAAIFYSGHLTAALGLACKEIGMLYFGYGFIGGIGLGIGYVTTIDAVIQWYPNARGLASGLAVSGFGSGAMAFSSINAALLRTFSIPVVFVILGSINFAVLVLCAAVMRPPPPDYNLPGVSVDMLSKTKTDSHYPLQSKVEQTIKGKSTTIAGQTITVGSDSGTPVLVIPLSQALASKDYWLLWVAFFVNLVFGVVIISNLAGMTTNMFGSDTPIVVTSIVTIEGVFNASGRLFFGWVSDWFGRRRTFLFIITLQISIVACLLVITPSKNFWPFVVMVWLATLCYGGGVGVIPATLADMFGVSNMSGCHGVILTGWSVAAIGGGLVYTGVVNLLTKHKGYAFSDPVVYVTNLYWILALLICGWVILLFVRVTPRERMFPRVRGQIFYHTLAGIHFRLARGARQNGLQDYEFLAAVAGGRAPSSDEHELEDIDFDACSLDTKQKSFDKHSVPPETFNSGTFLHEESSSPFGGNHHLASEAFNYVSDSRTSANPARDANRDSCVQLVYAMPPPRRCMSLFDRWRFEIVPKDETITVWRMYLSCALLASVETEK
ncbi:hypothetical protein GGI12_000841 [Dipsacomyces acuminosporus]|nr:hypothetical protein GGI12_000841 [Dipsacomyces acuminosporus]